MPQRNARKTLLLILLAIAAACGLLSRLAVAQVPPHPAGTVCFTPAFWCWAQPPGPPGNPCGCPGPNGWVGGVLG